MSPTAPFSWHKYGFPSGRDQRAALIVVSKSRLFNCR
jgi:hypothetical protein